MIETSLIKVQEQIDALHAFLNLIEFRDDRLSHPGSELSIHHSQGTPLRGATVGDRRMRHCAVIVSLYSLYEFYVDSIAQELLSFLPRHSSYDDLPEKLKQRHRMGLGKILSRKDYRQFKALNEHDILDSYRGCIGSAQDYSIVGEAILFRTTNLRGESLRKIFSTMPFDPLWDYLVKHKSIVRFLEAEEEQKGIEELLSELVELRNEVSHGVPDELIGVDRLRFWCTFLLKFCEALSDYAIHCITLKEIALGQKYIGKVTETFPRNGNVSIINARRGSIEIGSKLFAVLGHDVRSATVLSIQIEDDPVLGVSPTEGYFEVGVQTDTRLLKKSKVVLV